MSEPRNVWNVIVLEFGMSQNLQMPLIIMIYFLNSPEVRYRRSFSFDSVLLCFLICRENCLGTQSVCERMTMKVMFACMFALVGQLHYARGGETREALNEHIPEIETDIGQIKQTQITRLRAVQ